MDISALYLATRVPAQSLPAAIEGLRDPQVLGANVTIPHKTSVIPYLDGLSSVAEAIGAVNTIVRHDDGLLIGHNTDVEGFLAPLDVDSLSGLSATVFGNGGAARAVVYALLMNTQPQRVTIIGRSEEKVQRFIEEMRPFDPNSYLTADTFDDVNIDTVRDSGLIVNTTPLGMHPNISHTPWNHPETFYSNQIVYDLVYNPSKTRLLQEAAIGHATTISGLDMLITQAAAAFRLWTKQSFPEAHVLHTLNDAIT